MRPVYVVADNIFSPLGEDSVSNMLALQSGISGIREHLDEKSGETYVASLFRKPITENAGALTAFEHIVELSALNALSFLPGIQSDARTGFILSTTKGNIGIIENVKDPVTEERISLNASAERVAARLGIQTTPLVVSHACISGLLAMITGKRLIQSGVYDHVIITGADLISRFIYSGFQSFQAISAKPCRPFDASRDGITLGEAAATVILSSTETSGCVRLAGGSVSNDANHISGPSRTGEELWMAIGRALDESGIRSDEIDFISAHGTATRYNDEMEAKAIHLASMQNVPLNSLKGYFGHTLGAAGLLESIVTLHGMKENFILPTLGFSEPGTEKKVNVVKEFQRKKISKTLKTASGFGGCNAAIVMLNN